MQDITEQQEVAQEISDAISKPFGDQFDEVYITNRDVQLPTLTIEADRIDSSTPFTSHQNRVMNNTRLQSFFTHFKIIKKKKKSQHKALNYTY